jgi:hypothetical protein
MERPIITAAMCARPCRLTITEGAAITRDLVDSERLGA